MTDRKTHWEDVYRAKSPLEVSWYQEQPTLSLELIQATGIGKTEAIIDVGGGASLLVDELYKAGFSDLSVLDISAHALQRAKDRLAGAANRINWIEVDITQFSPSCRYSLWHDRAVFHFLTEQQDRERYLAALNTALRHGGHLLLAAFTPDGPRQCSGLDIVQYDASKLKTVLGGNFELVEERFEEHLTPANKIQQFAYYHFIRIGK